MLLIILQKGYFEYLVFRYGELKSTYLSHGGRKNQPLRYIILVKELEVAGDPMTYVVIPCKLR